VQQLSCLNDLIEYAPVPNLINDPEVQTPKFTDAQLLETRVLLAGRKLRYMPTCVTSPKLVIILSRTKILLIEIKFKKPKRHTNIKANTPLTKIKPNKPLNRNQKCCKIHGKCNHSSSQCDMIRKQREEYKSTTNNKNQKKRKNLDHPKYNTRSHTCKKQEQNNSLTTNQTNDASDAESEINHIEEVFHLQDSETKIYTVCTKIHVSTTSSDSQHTYLLGLHDTGATGSFIKQSVLKTIQHKIHLVDFQVKGRYSQSHITQIASFEIKLPDFCNHKTIMV
jgi:hypothetical protein